MEMQDFSNKVCLITGATSGIGLETASALASLGAELFLVCRNPVKGKQIVENIKYQTGNNRIKLLVGDLSSLQEVPYIAQTFLKYDKPLHLLLNNAGIFNTKRKLTVNGYEEMFAVNHLAHFLLTNLLVDRIKESAPARIVNVASGAHMLVKSMNFDDLNFNKAFQFLKVYSHSKLANILFTQELSERLNPNMVTVNSVDPGEVATNLGKQNAWFGKLISTLMKPFLQSPRKGAKTPIYVCTSQNLDGITGKYFRDCSEKQAKPWAKDAIAAQRLWELSAKMVNNL